MDQWAIAIDIPTIDDQLLAPGLSKKQRTVAAAAKWHNVRMGKKLANQPLSSGIAEDLQKEQRVNSSQISDERLLGTKSLALASSAAALEKKQEKQKQHGELSAESTTTLVMSNYFGVGIDAQVAHQFHRERKKRPSLFVSRLTNKVRLQFELYPQKRHHSLNTRVSSYILLVALLLLGYVFLSKS